MSGLTVLAVGATGSIGRHVAAEALAAGHNLRALVPASIGAQCCRTPPNWSWAM